MPCSGTLGRGAKGLGRLFFLAEKESKYFEYMKAFQPGEGLFGGDGAEFLTLEEFKESASECASFCVMNNGKD